MQLSQGPFSYNRFDDMDAAYKALYEKKAAKDYDGDGKVESGTAEYMGSKDKAIKKAMGKTMKEGKGEMPDFIKKKIEAKKEGGDKKEGKKDKCECKEDISMGHVMQYLIDNQFCNNEVSAEIMHNHMSEAMLNTIVDEIWEGFQPITPERKAKIDKQKMGAFNKDHMLRSKGDMAGADKQFKRRMAMDSMSKMKR